MSPPSIICRAPLRRGLGRDGSLDIGRGDGPHRPMEILIDGHSTQQSADRDGRPYRHGRDIDTDGRPGRPRTPGTGVRTHDSNSLKSKTGRAGIPARLVPGDYECSPYIPVQPSGPCRAGIPARLAPGDHEWSPYIPVQASGPCRAGIPARLAPGDHEWSPSIFQHGRLR